MIKYRTVVVLLIALLLSAAAARRLSVHADQRTPPKPLSSSGTVFFYTTSISIPTYPYHDYVEERHAGPYAFPWLDWSRYDNEAVDPVPWTYTLWVLENDYLRVTLLPELGGRIYQMIYKPTGHNQLYQNPVIKPTKWGPPEQGWWLAVGGIEWCLPVEEHGYEWGVPWSASIVSSTKAVTVTVRDTEQGDRLRARVDVALPTDRARLDITTHLENPTAEEIVYKYWSNAMLTPGAANTVGPDLHFIFNADEMSVHSTGDYRLPGHDQVITGPYHRFSWPVFEGTDFSRLGNWNRWIGFFEYPDGGARRYETMPHAQTDFAGVYDTAADEGVARVFPFDAARGSKGFGMGWSRPINAKTWTDGGSTYVELHGGVAPTFWDTATITAGASLSWTEHWYPVSEIGTLSAATAQAALGVRESEGQFHIGVHPTAPRPASRLYVWERDTGDELAHLTAPPIEPGRPFTASVATGGRTLDDVAVAYLGRENELLASLNIRAFTPTVSVEPLPPWVATKTFTVTWRGQGAWSGITSYDVQVRDGYEGEWSGWLTDTLTTSAPFTGAHGHTYAFRARARDLFGNQGTFGDRAWGDAFTTVLTEPAPVLVTSHKTATPQRFSSDQTIAYAVIISNTGNLTASATLTDTPPAFQSVRVLTETLSATAAPTPTYDGASIHWHGSITPGAEVHVTYALWPTTTLTCRLPLTNTAEIAGSVLGPFVRRAVTMKAYAIWLPLIIRVNGP